MSDYPPQVWYCSNCGHQNQLSFQHCPQCGLPLPGQQTYTPPPLLPKKSGVFKYFAFGCLGLIGLFVMLAIVGALFSKSSDTDSKIVIAPKLPPPPPSDEKISAGLARLQQMPEFSKVAESARRLGFRVSSFGDGQPSTDSLTGRAFMVTAEQVINGQNFKFVVMGPSSDRVDTVRLQAYGIQTKAARQILQKQAESVLASVNRGELPESFLRQFHAGVQVSDDGVSNGFCNVQVLQRPMNPAFPSNEDRISLDLIFDKAADQ